AIASHGASTFFTPDLPDKLLTPGGLRHASQTGEGAQAPRHDPDGPASMREAAWRPAWQKPLPDGARAQAARSTPSSRAPTGIDDADRPWLHGQRRTWRRPSLEDHDAAAPLPSRPSAGDAAPV